MRIKKFMAMTALAALPLIAAARPASPELMQHVNPDGSVVEFRMFGDEHFSYITDAQGDRLLEIDATGRIVPLMRDGKALRAVEADINRLISEMPKYEVPSTEVSGRKVSRMAQLESNGQTSYPSTGEVRSCVILLEYPDRPFSTAKVAPGATEEERHAATRELFDRLCNEEGFSEYGARGSARDYYVAASNGKFTPQFDVYGPVKLQHPAAWYVQVDADDPALEGHSQAEISMLLNPNYYKQPRYGYAIAEAMEALDDEVDFSIYDYDANGEIDNIFFFYSGQGRADSYDPTSVWPHQSDYRGYTGDYFLGTFFHLPRQIHDGVELTCYATSCELNSSRLIPDEEKPHLDGIGAFCHEFGHVLGLPDLYDTSNSGIKTPKDYSIMDSGSYNQLSTCPPLLSAYEQWVCRWIDYTYAEDNNLYELNPVTSDDRNAVSLRIRQPGGANSYYKEYYVLESRANEGWDESLPEHGMMIWRINFSNDTWAANEVNSYGSTNPRKRSNVEMINIPDTKSFAWPDSQDEIYSIYPEMEVFTPDHTTKPLEVYITNIEYDEQTGKSSFEYNMYKPTELVTVLHENPVVNSTKREIYLNWDEVPGMKYMLTVSSRNEATGAERYVDGLNDALIEENHRTVRNLTKSQWSQTITARVRLFNGVPAKNYSNTISFIPEQMVEGDEISGVESVGVSVPAIYGGKGCINAPEGAKVFNMSGVECGTTDLPAGVYIVVVPGATAKVSVY